MKTRLFTSISVMGALGFLAALPVYALGLGKIELSSALNEPFKAEIPVNAASGDEAETLQVRLASNDEFERAGLVKNAVITQLKFKVSQRAGKTIITVSSKNPVKEPLLDFLLLAKTSSGQLIREYTVLLDPPKHVFKAKPRASSVVASPNISQPKRVVSQPRPASNDYQYNAPSLAGTNSYGRTSRTDTLWDIALKTRPNRDVSVHQMMLALVDKNKKAFIKQNINGLKSGYTLAIPSASDLQKLSKQQAVAGVQQQNVAWKNRNRAPIESTVASTTVTPASQLEQGSTAEAKAEDALSADAATETAAEPTARLQLLGANDDTILSESDLGALGNEKVKELSDQLTMAQEVIEGQQQENIDIKSRMAAMEEQIQTLRKLIALQDPDLAKLQRKLEKEAAEAEAELEATAKLDALAEEIKADLNNNEQLAHEALADSDVVVDETVAEAELATVEEVASNEQLDVALAPVEEMAATPTLFEKIQAMLIKYKLQALLGVLGLLFGLFLLGRKRAEDERKVSWDEAVENIKSPAAPVSPVVVPAAAVVAADEVIAEPVKTVDDLIKDADVYVSYADFEKAGLALEEAYNDAPSNMAVIQKLLFTHYKQGKASAFVELAREYTVDRDSMEWAEVAEWGRSLDADNALFAEPLIEDPVVDLAELESGLAFNVDDELDIAEASVSEAEDDLLDFNIDLEATESVDINDATTAEEVEIEEIEALSDSDAAVIDSLSLTSEQDDGSLEIDGLGDITDGELAAASLALSGEDTDENALEFDLSDFDQVDEAETKLDLASAYIEMGDPNGAKTILEEIINEGNDEQRSRAKTLLDELS
jgi:pilus assembly protein FimV